MNRVHVAKTYGHAHAFLRDIVMSIPFGSIPVYFGGGGGSRICNFPTLWEWQPIRPKPDGHFSNILSRISGDN